MAANALCMLTNFHGHIKAAYSSLGPCHKSAYKQLYEPVHSRSLRPDAPCCYVMQLLSAGHWLEQGDVSAVALAANALCMLTKFNGHLNAAYSSLGPFHKSAYKQLYEPVRRLHGTAAGLNMLAFMFLVREAQYKQQPPVNDPADPEIKYISNAGLLAATLWPFTEVLFLNSPCSFSFQAC